MGTIYGVGSAAGTVSGFPVLEHTCKPCLYNPTGFTAIDEVSVFGNTVGGNSSNGFSMKGKDGHLYLVTLSHGFLKMLDNVATPIIAGGYGQQNIVAMQDGSFLDAYHKFKTLLCLPGLLFKVQAVST